MPHLMSWAVLLLSTAAVLVPISPIRAQGHVEHFEPPVLQRGKTTRLTVVGAQLGKASGLWTSIREVKATPVGAQSANRAVLDVTVAADAPVGICGVRLATDDGLANACLMLIDDLPVRALPAPNAKVALPAALWGRFVKETVDRVAIDVVAGQRV